MPLRIRLPSIVQLAGSTLHLCRIAETSREKNVDLVVPDQDIDTSDATGRLLFNMLGSIPVEGENVR